MNLKPLEKFCAMQDGLELYTQTYLKKNSQASLVFVHGIGEHSNRYQFPLRYFSSFSFSIYFYDQRGHGKSKGPRIYAPSMQTLVDDLHTIVQLAKKKEKKVFLVAHSFGGQVAINYLASHPRQVAGALISSPNLRLAVKIPTYKKWLGKYLAFLLPTVALDNEIDPTLLSHDPEVVKAYIEDELVEKKISFRMAQIILDNLETILQLAPKIQDPMFLMHGGADQVCDPKATQEFYHGLKVRDKQIKIYEGFYHEIFNEIGRQEVFEDMLKWTKAHL